MSTCTTLASGPAVSEVQEALLVWVSSTTVGAERSRLSKEVSRARSVFGLYGETTQPAVARVVEDLRDLKHQPDNATLIPVPHVFGVTPASQLLPRGARVVGWLDADGYRRVRDTPQPSAEWLDDQRARLR